MHLGQGVEQEHGLAPSSVDLVPLHGAGRRAAQAEARDGREGALVPDVERIVVHIGMPQALEMRRRPLNLQPALPSVPS